MGMEKKRENEVGNLELLWIKSKEREWERKEKYDKNVNEMKCDILREWERKRNLNKTDLFIKSKTKWNMIQILRKVLLKK